MVRPIRHFNDHKWATREIRRNRSKQCYFRCEGNNYISVTLSKPMASLHIPHSFKHSFRWSDKVHWLSHSPVPRLQQIAFNLRQTTRECVYFVKLVHTNFQPVTLTLTRWPWYINLTEIFRIFTCTSTVNVPGQKTQNIRTRRKHALFLPDLDLDLDPITFTYELDPYPLKIYQYTKNELSTSRL